jgi:ubiquinone/menaquinone biosynthesis C-methylase UbiE
MDIKDVQEQWNEFGKIDPLWAVLTYAGKEGNRWNQDEFFATGVQEIDGVLKDLKKLNLAIPPGRVLDFGCAVGRLTQALADHFPDVAGVDIAPSMLELGRQLNRHGDRCQYYLNSEDNLQQFPDATFAFVLTLITLQHVQPRYAHNYLKEFMRLLKPGGVLVFQLPSHMTPEYMRRQGIKRMVPDSVYRFYRRIRYKMPMTADNKEPTMEMYGTPRDEVVRLLEANGGEVRDVQQDGAAGNWVGYRYYVRKSG